jgi:two-component system chemotaxis response regulator CheY
VLILATETSKDKRDEGRGAGATGWIVKPFDPDKLVATIRKFCPAA